MVAGFGELALFEQLGPDVGSEGVINLGGVREEEHFLVLKFLGQHAYSHVNVRKIHLIPQAT
jgi:hypothetical protein